MLRHVVEPCIYLVKGLTIGEIEDNDDPFDVLNETKANILQIMGRFVPQLKTHLLTKASRVIDHEWVVPARISRRLIHRTEVVIDDGCLADPILAQDRQVNRYFVTI